MKKKKKDFFSFLLFLFLTHLLFPLTAHVEHVLLRHPKRVCLHPVNLGISLFAGVKVNKDSVVVVRVDAGLSVDALTSDFPQQFVGVQAVNVLLPIFGEKPLHTSRFYKKTENNHLHF